MGLLQLLFGKRPNRTREAAIALGLGVTDVERDAPIFNSMNKLERLERDSCPRYSLPVESAPATRWAFLQRDELAGAPYPNGWTWQSPSGATPPAAVHTVLSAIAKEWQEEYLEFECDGAAVHAFWSEWGGADGAQQIATYLRRIVEAVNRDAAS